MAVIDKMKMVVAMVTILGVVSAGAGHWQLLGLSGRQVYSLETDPTDSQLICAGTDNGVYVSFDGGGLWWQRLAGNYVPFLSYDQLLPDTLFGLLGGGSPSDGLYLSTDNGNSWTLVSSLFDPRRMGFDPVNPGFIYLCFADGILKSQDSGQNYSSANNGLPQLNILDIKGAYADEFKAYAVGETFVARTIDFGNNWSSMGGLFGLEDYNPSRLEIEPNAPETLYVSCQAYVARSYNGGISWEYTQTPTVANMPIACDPEVSGRLFVGSANSGGVLKSSDAGVSFTALNDSLGDLNVYSLELDSDGRLLAGTADGLYLYDFSASAVDDDLPVPLLTALYQNYPNPFNNRTLIEFTIDSSQHVKVEIYDITGRLVRTLFDGAAYGRRSLWWNGIDNNGDSVASGIYIYSLKTADQAVYRKMTLLK